jgi:hypothetical protein
MKKLMHALVAAALVAAAGVAAVTPPATAAVVGSCTVTVTAYRSVPKATAYNQSCTVSGAKIKAVLYYYLSNNGATTYSTRGSSVTVGGTSTAQTSSGRIYASGTAEQG